MTAEREVVDRGAGAGTAAAASRSFDVLKVREDFPILATRVHGKPLVYLDNAATTQKPRMVIDSLTRFYREENANIHRGVHYLSERATVASRKRWTVRRASS